jgi:Kef-type K+ transport system membrane component KefB
VTTSESPLLYVFVFLVFTKLIIVLFFVPFDAVIERREAEMTVRLIFVVVVVVALLARLGKVEPWCVVLEERMRTMRK